MDACTVVSPQHRLAVFALHYTALLTPHPRSYSVAGRITAGALGDQEFIYLNGATQTRRWVYKVSTGGT